LCTYPLAGAAHQLKLFSGNMKSSINTKARCCDHASAPGRRLLRGAVVITTAPKLMVDWSSSAMSPFKRVPPAPGKEWRGVEWSGVVQQQFSLEWSGVEWSGVECLVQCGVECKECSAQCSGGSADQYTGLECSAVQCGVEWMQCSGVKCGVHCSAQCSV
jgi:hypothetical protein